ncbi:polymorphic toxin type 43 domain-containing protein [Saccharopolyspora antimicrobica]|uniref:polymorphic toxin type 43 domain-containing protein n=1 Tax=Saccharopolyspora antimicrobica TaxID=455193 RepID=UPI00210B4FE9|nr:polymorphic toxin type 43 domain-containing protein [Saccharopolyspora antimicrobica]
MAPCPDDSKLPGSGPIPGVLEVSDRVKSVGAVENFFPKGERDFVFDPVQNRFVTGSEQGILGHDGLRESIGGSPSDVVGGRLSRGPNGEFLTNEWSGHYGHQWTPEIRQKFIEFMGEHGLEVAHTPWGG